MTRSALPCMLAALAAACSSAAPQIHPPDSPPPPPIEKASPAPTATVAAVPPSPAPRAASATPQRRGDGVDLVHVVCTINARTKPLRSSCTEAAPDAPRLHNLAHCDRLTRRPATAGVMKTLSEVWTSAAREVSNNGRPLDLGAGVMTPRGIPRPASVNGRPAVMLVELRLLGKRHAKNRGEGCDNPPPNTGCDPVSVGYGPLVDAEAKGSAQMVSQGFGGVGICTGPAGN